MKGGQCLSCPLPLAAGGGEPSLLHPCLYDGTSVPGASDVITALVKSGGFLHSSVGKESGLSTFGK